MVDAIVTGGAGFIGSHLCSCLLGEGRSVLCVDNLSTGRKRTIEPLLRRPGFTLLEHDVTIPLPEIVQACEIYHLASPASVPDYLSRPIDTLLVNSTGTRTMLDLAERTGARFLFASTSEIYGDPLVHPQAETYWGNVNPNGPRSCYDEGKRFGEALTMAYVRTRNVDGRIIRIFNTYGPHSRVDDGRIVPNFISQALRREPITIYGDGTQTRSFCYVEDLVEGILAAMRRDRTSGEVFNLGNPDEYTVAEFAAIIADRLRSEAGFIHKPLPTEDPSRRRPDITKTRIALGWGPGTSLSEGVDRTAEWFRGELLSEASAG